MSLIRPFSSQIDTSDIDSTEFASETQVNSVQSNLDSFASYANSTFSTGGGGGGGGTATGNGVVFSDSFTTSNVSSNEFTLSASVAYGENLLVYLNGLLQHPDAYVVSANTLTLINTDPLPSGLKVSVRELSVAGGVTNVTVANASTARSSNLANGSLLFDYEGSNLYVYDGSVEGGYFLPLKPSVLSPAYSFQGSISGYTSGGLAPPVNVNTIDKFPFSSDSNATLAQVLNTARSSMAGHSSSTDGYISGGTPLNTNIAKFPFAVSNDSIVTAQLTQSRLDLVGQSSSTRGYSSGGGTPTLVNTVDKFSFIKDENASDVGDLTVARSLAAGQSSSTHGYTSGGNPVSNVIDKFPFSADVNAADVGDLTQARLRPTGQSSSVSGYASGGGTPTLSNVIDKFPFASDSNATDVGDLTQSRQSAAGQSSTESGYISGGGIPGVSDTIDRFAFSIDSNASDVGDLTQARISPAGHQV
jgi:hypothetical protein